MNRRCLIAGKGGVEFYTGRPDNVCGRMSVADSAFRFAWFPLRVRRRFPLRVADAVVSFDSSPWFGWWFPPVRCTAIRVAVRSALMAIETNAFAHAIYRNSAVFFVPEFLSGGKRLHLPRAGVAITISKTFALMAFPVCDKLFHSVAVGGYSPRRLGKKGLG